MLTEAHASRTDGLITVRMIGQSPTLYDEATIVGYYPGMRTTITGPCSAQVFIREGRKREFENTYCPPIRGNIWTLHPVFLDKYAKTVDIFINECFVRKIRVLELTVSGMYKIIEF